VSTGLPDIDTQTPAGAGECVSGASTADVLRLLGAGATGAILMALGEGPLRTKELTERVPGFAPRTIYRYAGKLAELDVIARDEEPGVPSKVVHSLTEGCGSELYELVNRYADASLTRLPDGRLDAHAWASVGHLGDLWEAGMVEDLACEPLSPTELAQGEHGLSYHQVNRRAGLFQASGLLAEWESPGRRRCYALTEKTRRKMGLLAAIARWRHRHVVAEDEEGMTAPEMATVLRASLQLVALPEHKGKRLRVDVRSGDDTGAPRSEAVCATVEPDGTIHSCATHPEDPDGWGRGLVATWIPVLLDGRTDAVPAVGEEKLVRDCLDALYETLWTPVPL
jgi:DNA-binding HxlR family transcriptional regulator